MVVLTGVLVLESDFGSSKSRNLTSVLVSMKNMRSMKIISVMDDMLTSAMCRCFFRSGMID
jgi:hypothetical protein